MSIWLFKKNLQWCIYKNDLTLECTVETLNLFYSHSFFNVGLIHYFFKKNTKYF